MSLTAIIAIITNTSMMTIIFIVCVLANPYLCVASRTITATNVDG